MEPEDYSRLIARDLPASAETVPLAEAVGRILARDVPAPAPIPGFATSAMDGFALDAPALDRARTGEPVPVAGDIPAGHAPVPIPSGCAVRVMTGAEVPDSAAAVVPVELTDAERTGVVPASITVTGLPDPVVPGWNIRDVGEDTAAGDVVVLGGQRLGAAGIGTLAMLGIEAVDVARPLRVGLVVTGDELQPGEGAPRIPNSNLPMLASALGSHGFTVLPATSSDDPVEFLAVLDDLLPEVDLVITTGGISAGAYEVVRAALEGECSEFLRVGQRPGGPQGHGERAGTPLLHFPGTPAGAYLSFHLFALPLLTGTVLAQRWRRGLYEGPALQGHRRGVSLVPATIAVDGRVVPAARARLRDFAGADAILRVPAAPGGIADGDGVDILPTGPGI
ncbi:MULTISPECIES: molybdopterin molybdotransferase MoeA [Brevibacterium]|uniref:Molybdopterin molybdenumtransferase n=1 Tax=Brevibacterium casei S18 TaxID=1229781 RepID=K9AQM5_9MICO|nr:molybdopterin molybdotransferase MoeA [Brevibacterium casei]EKU49594.1 molybdenum cofactor biosynthesis protein [Brevibacterium casei S18]NJE68556.1 molybdopterin molybdenumtransferase MoeA [Brevibacterium sp. LS14]